MKTSESIICHNCGNRMHLTSFTDTFTINNIPVQIPVTGYICESCHEIVYSSAQIKQIELRFNIQ